MYDAGIANLESSDSKVYNNIFKNVKYGIRISLGGQNNEIYDNTFENCSQCKCPHAAFRAPSLYFVGIVEILMVWVR